MGTSDKGNDFIKIEVRLHNGCNLLLCHLKNKQNNFFLRSRSHFFAKMEGFYNQMEGRISFC